MGRKLSRALPVTCVLLLALLAGSASASREEAEQALARGRAFDDQGDVRAADEAFQQAARLARDANWPQGEEESLRRRMGCVQELHDLLGMRDVSRAQLAFYERTGDAAHEARSRADLGYLETELGDPRAGLRSLARAERYARQHRDEELLAQFLVRVSHARALTRDHAGALEAIEEAVARLRALPIPEDPARRQGDLADALTVLGSLHLDLGDPVLARRWYEEALQLYEEIDPAVGPYLQMNIGISWYVEGRYEKALALLASAAERLQELRDSTSAAHALVQAGYVRSLMGRHRLALTSYAAARELSKGNPVARAYALLHEADARFHLGEMAKAMGGYEEARQGAAVVYDRSLRAHALRGTADVLLATGDHAGALTAARASLALVHEIMGGLAPVSGALARDQSEAVYATALRAGFASGDPAAAFEMLERSRAATLLERLGAHAAVGLPDLPVAVAAEESQARAALRVAQLTYAAAREGGDLKATRAAGQALESARLVYESALDKVQRAATPAQRAALPNAADPAAVQKHLAADEVLVLYGIAGGEVHALVLTKTARRVRTLGGADIVEQQVRTLRRKVADGADVEKDVTQLRKVLLLPLDLPVEGRHLLIGPDGVLTALPFALLAPEHTVTLVPSGTVLRLLREADDVAGKGILALGDPDYRAARDEGASQVYWKGRPLGRLEGTRAEVEGFPGKDVLRLLDRDATEEALAAGLASRDPWRLVHLGCHGLLHDERPAHTCLALTPGPESDGFLTVQEIFGMRIPTDLAVLSACDSGGGAALAGNGLVGLSQAFLYAGARRVVATLWKVDDDASAFLIDRFYAHWMGRSGAPRLGAAEALRRAQAETAGKKKWSDARYWAAWVLWGLPR